MRFPLTLTCLLLGVVLPVTEVSASETLLEDHCYKCHNDEKSKGDFKIAELGAAPMDGNFERWLDALDMVTIEDMPPEDESELTVAERERLVAYLEQNIKSFEAPRITSRPRRMNNREFANSVRDALLLEDVGTHFPLASLVGDSRHHGFDTHGETLGMSRFHLENYVEAIRNILDATLQSGKKPEAKRYRISAQDIEKGSRAGPPSRRPSDKYVDFNDPRDPFVLKALPSIPATGRYRITIRATGMDRTLYATEDTGYYHADPIQLKIQMGDRERLVDLPDETPTDIELNEWLAAGTELKFWHQTDAFRMLHNGGFKHQRAIAGAYLKETDPAAFRRIFEEQESLRNRFPERPPDHSVFWRNEWHGARPRLYSVDIEGPLYESWPSKRQVALLGENPTVEQAQEILKPIAERAWRRPVLEDELAPMVASVEENAERLGIVDAYKEGILGVLISPAFLILDGEDLCGRSIRFEAELLPRSHASLARSASASRPGKADFLRERPSGTTTTDRYRESRSAHGSVSLQLARARRHQLHVSGPGTVSLLRSKAGGRGYGQRGARVLPLPRGAQPPGHRAHFGRLQFRECRSRPDLSTGGRSRGLEIAEIHLHRRATRRLARHGSLPDLERRHSDDFAYSSSRLRDGEPHGHPPVTAAA